MPIASVESLTTQALTLALDAASLRHQVIAANIANANTPGHVPQRASFEALVEAGARGAAGPAAELRAHLEPDPGARGLAPGAAVDAEVAALARNTLHQQVLLRALQRHLEMLSSAVGEGRR
jgi:flagellar basal-body rod protein FlgB